MRPNWHLSNDNMTKKLNKYKTVFNGSDDAAPVASRKHLNNSGLAKVMGNRTERESKPRLNNDLTAD